MKNSPGDSLTSEKTNVKTVVDQFVQFWETHDMELLTKIMAHDADMVSYGSDASEHFVGWEAFKDAVVQMLPSFQDTKITVSDQVIKIGPSADIAWFSEVWNWHLKMEGNPVQIDGQRLTGVLEKRDGNWVFVQFHNSVPVA
ncbi:MAG TPA: SgcJ/EcaC family oxidoreductase [Saprospiraceae bacterium]|nr:SgcJ/EcaC family oxidoreductase [Saprospiraceae bacterium]